MATDTLLRQGEDLAPHLEDDRLISLLLLVEDPAYQMLIHKAIAELGPVRYEVSSLDRLEELTSAAAARFDAVLLDCPHSVAHAVKALVRLRELIPSVPVIMLSEPVAEGSPVEAGSKASSGALSRAVRYSVDRRRFMAELPRLALLDDLTGLHNRRGFFQISNQCMKMAQRMDRNMVLFLMDLDGLKNINDTLGHASGDAALKETAEVLRGTFRESDVVARIGGDEFAALAIEEAGHTAEAIPARLRKQLAEINAAPRDYTLSLSLGSVRIPAAGQVSMEGLMAQADHAMYLQKRSHRTLARQPASDLELLGRTDRRLRALSVGRPS